jgi:hypothetical protein
MPIMFSIVNNGDDSFATAIIPGHDPLVAGQSHPNYDRIVEALVIGVADTPEAAEELADLFDVETAIATRFSNLSERVQVGNGRVYFDGDEQHGSIVKQIVRFLDEGVSDWYPLVNFMERVASNPNEHSRSMLYDWLNCHDFTLTSSGKIVGYKGVHKDDEGNLVSGWEGQATVNGQVVKGRIPNAIGNIVEMPRSEVTHDPSDACSTGLHVGTHRYAKSYARGAMLKVIVDPRDVVSVPTDARGEKVRVSRYYVAEVIDAELATPVDESVYAREQALCDETFTEDECSFPSCDCDTPDECPEA